MSFKVLFVESDMDIVSGFKEEISDYADQFDIRYAGTREEALSLIDQLDFSKVITGLKIPRISQGYYFLSEIVNKKIEGQHIIIIVDKIDVMVKSSIHAMEIANLFSKTELTGVVQILLASAGLTASGDQKKSETFAGGKINLENIKTSLNIVMGPVGDIIFKDVCNRWTNQNNPQELINLIKTEIKDTNKIGLFLENL